MNYTERHNLPQWEKDDRIQMEDFNTAMAVLDAAPKISVGSYIGNGIDSRTIELSFTPKAVFVATQRGEVTHNSSVYLHYGGLAVTGSNASAVSIVENGFMVRYVYNTNSKIYYYTNTSGTAYNYIAIG